MRIFDDSLRVNHEFSGQTEPIFKFLDTCSRDDVALVRQQINRWFDAYPDVQKVEFRKRLRSRNNETFYSAYFELFSYFFLSRLFPTIPNKQGTELGRMFDFTCQIGQQEVCIESTVVYESKGDLQKTNRRARISDFINSNAKVPGFRFHFEIDVEGTSEPGLRSIIEPIKRWAKGFDRAEIRRALSKDPSTELPKRVFVTGDWQFSIALIPKSTDEDKPGDVAIGIGPSFSGWKNDAISLRNSLAGKASRYDNLNGRPYFIMCNSMLPFNLNHIDVMSALFGTEVTWVNLTTGQATNQREPDGLWLGPKGPQNTRLNGVFFFDTLNPWTVNERRPTLYLNPWPENKFSCKWWKWSRREVDFEKHTYDFSSSEEFPEPFFEKY